MDRKLWVVFKREYLERTRSKWFLVATFLGPLFFAAITVLPIVMSARTRTSSDVTHVVILDATGSDLGARVQRTLADRRPGSPEPELRVVTPETLAQAESTATREVMARRYRGFLVLDGATIAGQEVRYAGRNASSLVDVGTLTTTVRQSLLAQRLEREGIDPGRVTTLTTVRLESKTERIGDRGRESGGGMASLFFGYGVAFLLYMMIVLYGQNVLRGVMEEKTTRVAEVVVSSVRANTLLAGKVLGVGSVALTQVFAWLAMSFLIYQVRQPLLARFGAAGAGGFSMPGVSPGSGVALLLFFVLGFIFYAALFAAVGAMVNNQEDAQQAAMPVMLLLVASIVFMQPILLNPSSGLARLMSLLPFSAPILMPLRMSMVSVPWWEIGASLVGVALFCIAAIWLSARIYRVGLLMYGKRPSMRELARWVKDAG